MDNAFWNSITRYGTRIQVEPGNVLDCQSTYLLDEGICALTSFTKRGGETVYIYFKPPRIICFNHLLHGQKDLPMPEPEFSVIAKTRCALYRMAASDFNDLVAQNAKFQLFLLEILADNYHEALVHFHRMQEESASSRLCRLLLDVSQVKGQSRTIPRFFTYTELAKYLGTHPVTVSRIMAKLKHGGYITKTANGITIEKAAALKQLVDSESPFPY